VLIQPLGRRIRLDDIDAIGGVRPADHNCVCGYGFALSSKRPRVGAVFLSRETDSRRWRPLRDPLGRAQRHAGHVARRDRRRRLRAVAGYRPEASPKRRSPPGGNRSTARRANAK
jgi:hypothetical protein